MSAPYTLHVPPGFAPGDPRALDEATLVRDGFSWGAFLVPALWLASHRHWVMALAVLAAIVLMGVGLWAAGAGAGAIVAAELVLHLLFGLEGASLRRFALDRTGQPAQDVVMAGGLAEAEGKSFARWLGPAEPRPSPFPQAFPPERIGRDEPIIGLFPDLERSR